MITNHEHRNFICSAHGFARLQTLLILSHKLHFVIFARARKSNSGGKVQKKISVISAFILFILHLHYSGVVMALIEKNIEFLPYQSMPPWRKLAISTWRSSEEASFYGWMDIDASGIHAVNKRLHEQGKRISPTAIAAKAVAVAIAGYPKVNGVIRFGRIYLRKTVDVFFQVAPDDSGDTLSGIVIRDCNNKSLEEIHDEIKQRVTRIRGGQDDFAKFGAFMTYLPGFVVGWLQALASFISYQLNLWSPLIGLPKDAFGSAMVTSVGMLGIQRGFAPLLPYVECPIIITIGKLEDKPVVKDGTLQIAEVLPICATMDHRLVDGVGASKLMNTLKQYFENPY